MHKIQLVRQLDTMDCGPACLKMIARYHGRDYSLEYLRRAMCVTRAGVSMKGISRAAVEIGMEAVAGKITIDALLAGVRLPCIAYWNQCHFVVVCGVANGRIHVADPGVGFADYTPEEFCAHWVCEERASRRVGIVLLLSPTDKFATHPEERRVRRSPISYLRPYVSRYRASFLRLLASLFVGSALQLLFPFLTQAVVDRGIAGKDIHLVWLILLGEVALLTGSTAVDFLRRRIFLYISTHVGISLISDFFAKLMRLPMRFFYTKHSGDLLQRIDDHERVDTFLCEQCPLLLFSAFSMLTLGAVLAYYSVSILAVFVAGNALYATWMLLFLRRRRMLDYLAFEQEATQKELVYQMVGGMQEIKLQGCERQKRSQWRRIQDELFSIRRRSLSLSQTQEAGGIFLGELCNVFIIILSAGAVIDGHLTLGVMLAVQGIVGQLRGPVDDVMSFIYQWQDVTISLERISEIHTLDDEQAGGRSVREVADAAVSLDHVSFRYNDTDDEDVIKDLTLRIPDGKVTAIVGASGSGKTTLAKLVLGYFSPAEGTVSVGGTDMSRVDLSWWRSQCAAVMQDGVIFSDTIARNIAPQEDKPDAPRMEYAARMADILEHIQSLPLGFSTMLYQEGKSMSKGQRQRLLIARAVYRQARLLILDEATNSLDAVSESAIVRNLSEVFRHKTVIVIAHRLSTVRNADNIVVLDHGRIVEQGTHDELTARRGAYYALVRNQLELGE